MARPDATSEIDRITVTPGMLLEGVDLLLRFQKEEDDPELAVREIFHAMLRASHEEPP